LGSVDDIDKATDRVFVVAASARVAGDLAKLIRQTLRRSNLLETATVSKLTTADWQVYEAISRESRRRPTKG
jgi:hypothetical protein